MAAVITACCQPHCMCIMDRRERSAVHILYYTHFLPTFLFLIQRKANLWAVAAFARLVRSFVRSSYQPPHSRMKSSICRRFHSIFSLSYVLNLCIMNVLCMRGSAYIYVLMYLLLLVLYCICEYQ